MARFQFFSSHRLTDRQNRLLNPASRMRARGNNYVLERGGGSTLTGAGLLFDGNGDRQKTTL